MIEKTKEVHMYDTAMFSSYKKNKIMEKKSLKHGNVGLKALFCKIINKIWRRIIFDCKSRIFVQFLASQCNDNLYF